MPIYEAFSYSYYVSAVAVMYTHPASTIPIGGAINIETHTENDKSFDRNRTRFSHSSD